MYKKEIQPLPEGFMDAFGQKIIQTISEASCDKKKMEEDQLDPVNKKAVKKDFDDREDKDIDNDGDVDSSDEYLHKRRKAISKAIAKEEQDPLLADENPVTENGQDAISESHFKVGDEVVCIASGMEGEVVEVGDEEKEEKYYTVKREDGKTMKYAPDELKLEDEDEDEDEDDDEEEMEEELKKNKDDPCWKDYVQVGMKKKNGKEVPNCVPKEEVEEGTDFASHRAKPNLTKDDAKKMSKVADMLKKERDNKMKKEEVELDEAGNTIISFIVRDKEGKIKGGTSSEREAKSMAFRINGTVETLKKAISSRKLDSMVAMGESVELDEFYDDNYDTGADEEVTMGLRQLYFIQYAAEEIMDYLEMRGDMDEWFQNKLSNVHSMIQGLHAYIEGDKRMQGFGEEVDLDEARSKTSAPKVKGYKSGPFTMAQVNKAIKDSGLSGQQAARLRSALAGMNEEVEQVEEGRYRGQRTPTRKAQPGMKTLKQIAADMKAAADKKKAMKKEEVELSEKYEVVTVKTIDDAGEDKALSYGRKKGYKEAGVIGDSPIKAMVLFHLKPEDKKDLKGANVKAGEQVFRYATRSTVAGDIFPLIKVNFDKGMAYYLTQESSSGEIDEVKFETKGNKLKFARLMSGVAEEVEQIDELKKSTLGSYIKKASDDARNKSNVAVARYNTGRGYANAAFAQQMADNAAEKRKKGIAKAVDKLTREEVELDEGMGQYTHYIIKDSSGKVKHHEVVGDESGNSEMEHRSYLRKSVMKSGDKLVSFDMNTKSKKDALKHKIAVSMKEEVEIEEATSDYSMGKVIAKRAHDKQKKKDAEERLKARGWVRNNRGGWSKPTKEEVDLEEKAVSQAQQKLMGMALAYKRGEMDDASDEVKKVANSMSEKDLEDFAKTKHDDLPMKKEKYLAAAYKTIKSQKKY